MFKSNQCAGIVGRRTATGREVMAREAAYANQVDIKIIDCEKAGIIGGPFAVWVIKGGKLIASTSGIKGPTGANGVARNYGFAYRVAEADVPKLPVAA